MAVSDFEADDTRLRNLSFPSRRRCLAPSAAADTTARRPVLNASVVARSEPDYGSKSLLADAAGIMASLASKASLCVRIGWTSAAPRINPLVPLDVCGTVVRSVAVMPVPGTVLRSGPGATSAARGAVVRSRGSDVPLRAVPISPTARPSSPSPIPMGRRATVYGTFQSGRADLCPAPT